MAIITTCLRITFLHNRQRQLDMLIAFALAYATCMALSLAMTRHFQQVWPRQKLSPRLATLLRNGGWMLLVLTLVYCAKLEGIAVGLVLLLGLFSAAAFLLSL